MKKILILGLLSVIGYYYTVFFRFCHPFPKSEFFITLGIQFTIPFASYIISPRLGRIMTITCALLLVRVAPIFGMQSPLITLMGVFLGGVFGNFIREIITYFRNRKSNLLNTDTEYLPLLTNPLFLLISFLLIITLDRFLILFNAPYLKGFGILETMYVKGVSSKEAFALSMETITHLLFPLLYFYSEELREEDKTEIRKDWKLGVLIGLGIHFGIMFLQIFWNRNFLATNTNLSLEANRVMGLFRDSGSSTWIVPVLCFLFYKSLPEKDITGSWSLTFINRKTSSKTRSKDLLSKKKHFILLLFFVIQFILAPYQGRGFWLLLLVGIVFLLYSIWKENQERLPSINRFWVIATFGLFLIILYQIPRTTGSTFDKLLLIPIKFISMVQAKENPFLAVDSQRYYFNLAAWKVFLQNPLFGDGVGSFVVNLKDPTLGLFIPENKIDNPSFFMGILSEIGIVGLILITLYLLIAVSIRENILLLILFLLSLSFGYHVVQPDSGFVILLVLFIGFKEKIKADVDYKIRITMIILILFTLLHSVFQVIRQGRLPEFRQAKLNVYQLLSYEHNRGEANNPYHIFKGKTIWTLAGADGIELDAFLDNSTSKKTLRQKWTVLDKNRKPISDLEITIEKNKSNLNLFRIPDNGYYLQVEELDEKGKSQFYGDVPFCVPVIHFTEKNEFL
ncbi:MAG TPA: hypothetical protein PLG41_09565 [Leptospiraceae bacterium]|nr:hypothetical protein [Leptospiraceae bacterium]